MLARGSERGAQAATPRLRHDHATPRAAQPATIAASVYGHHAAAADAFAAERQAPPPVPKTQENAMGIQKSNLVLGRYMVTATSSCCHFQPQPAPSL